MKKFIIFILTIFITLGVIIFFKKETQKAKASSRPPAVAGTFYPMDKNELTEHINNYLSHTKKSTQLNTFPKALIVPHAGYIYSGAVAASGYALLKNATHIKRVILLGPAHHVPFDNIALPTVTHFETPLGKIPIDIQAIKELSSLENVTLLDLPHMEEHSLEVQLPFLQTVLKDFSLIPAVIGHTSPEIVASFLEKAWGGKETLIVISSDLSHYLDYNTCNKIDQETIKAIEKLDPYFITGERACGYIGLNSLLLIAKEKELSVQTIDVRNSGDITGEKERVVGYGAWAFFEENNTGSSLLKEHGKTLLKLAVSSIKHGFEHEKPLTIDLKEFPKELREKGAVFITLEKEGQLRGCIGSPLARHPLVEDVVENAYKAAFHDSRFEPLSEEEINENLTLSVSLLTEPIPMSFENEKDVLQKLRPGIDGVIFEDKGHKSLYLPSVWKQLPEPNLFLNHLKEKAGFSTHYWSSTVKISRFTSHTIKSTDIEERSNIWE